MQFGNISDSIIKDLLALRKRLVKATAVNSAMENEVLWGLLEGTQDRDQRRFPQKVILKG